VIKCWQFSSRENIFILQINLIGRWIIYNCGQNNSQLIYTEQDVSVGIFYRLCGVDDNCLDVSELFLSIGTGLIDRVWLYLPRFLISNWIQTVNKTDCRGQSVIWANVSKVVQSLYTLCFDGRIGGNFHLDLPKIFSKSWHLRCRHGIRLFLWRRMFD